MENLLKVEDFEVEKFGNNTTEDEKLISEEFLPPLPEGGVEENIDDDELDDEDNRVTTRSMAKKVTFEEPTPNV